MRTRHVVIAWVAALGCIAPRTVFAQGTSRVTVVTEMALPAIVVRRPRAARILAEAGLGTAGAVTSSALMGGAGAGLGVLLARPTPGSSNPFPIYGALIGVPIGLAVGAPLMVYLAGRAWGGRGSALATVLMSLGFSGAATLVAAGVCVGAHPSVEGCATFAVVSAAIAPAGGAVFGYELTDAMARRRELRPSVPDSTSSLESSSHSAATRSETSSSGSVLPPWIPFAAAVPGGGVAGIAAAF